MTHLNDSFKFPHQRIILRFYQYSDFTNWQELLSNMKPKQNQWDWEPEKLEELTETRFLAKLEKHKSERDAGTIYYFCVENEEKKLIGMGILNEVGENSAEIGFQLSNRYWGKGYGTEVAQALIKFANQDLKLASISAKVNKANGSSIHILEKVGMERVSENESQWVYEKVL